MRHENSRLVRYVSGALLNLHANLRHTERGTQLQWLSTLVRRRSFLWSSLDLSTISSDQHTALPL